MIDWDRVDCLRQEIGEEDFEEGLRLFMPEAGGVTSRLAYPAPPMFSPEDAETVRSLVAKGSLGGGVFETDDCQATYAELSAKGVTFLQEPAERPYGTEALFRDDSGNWFSLTQAKWRGA